MTRPVNQAVPTVAEAGSAAAGPVLVGCAHGTRGPLGRRTVARLLLDVAAARPGLDVEAAFVDVQPPGPAQVVGRLREAGREAVVVPVLLSAGYHVHVDVARAVQGVPGAVATPPLGPDDRLAALLLERLVEAGAAPGDAVVVAAAGSSDDRSAADVEAVAAGVAAGWAGPVRVAYGASRAPSVPDAVAALRAQGAGRVAVASYLLAPGHFHDRLGEAGADLVTAPLASPEGADPRLVDLLLARYDDAAATLHRRG